jgi:molybdopterin molybdotransferase
MTEPLLSVAEARARILSKLAPLPAEEVPLAEALGRVLAAPVIARRASPPIAVSAMDGYALEAGLTAAGPVELAVSQTIAAGVSPRPLAPGTAARIFTGAGVPRGADCIVPQEAAEARAPGRVFIKESPRAGHHVRSAGSDFASGALGLAEGQILNPRDLGLAAAMNWSALNVRRRPRVAILATGDELVPPGGAPLPHQIIASSGPALAAALRLWGADAIDLGLVGDDQAAIAATIGRARNIDLLLTLGGASVGDHDLVQRTLTALGFELGFWRVAMRPGKPLLYGCLGPLPVIGLPGNPVSTLICALLFVRPAIATLLGRRKANGDPDIAPPTAHAVLSRDLAANGSREDYLRARLEDGEVVLPTVVPFERQDSAQLLALAEADCLVPRTPFAPPSKAGDAHTIIPLAGLF